MKRLTMWYLSYLITLLVYAILYGYLTQVLAVVIGLLLVFFGFVWVATLLDGNFRKHWVKILEEL